MFQWHKFLRAVNNNFLKERREVMNSNLSNIPWKVGYGKYCGRWNMSPSHLHLIWCILHNRNPVKFSLFNRVINCTQLCCFCDQNNETVDHLSIMYTVELFLELIFLWIQGWLVTNTILIVDSMSGCNISLCRLTMK